MQGKEPTINVFLADTVDSATKCVGRGVDVIALLSVEARRSLLEQLGTRAMKRVPWYSVMSIYNLNDSVRDPTHPETP